MAPSVDEILSMNDEQGAAFIRECGEAVLKIVAEEDLPPDSQPLLTPDDERFIEAETDAVSNLVADITLPYPAPPPNTTTNPWENFSLDQFRSYVREFTQKVTGRNIALYLELLSRQEEVTTDPKDATKQRAQMVAKGRLKLNWIVSDGFFQGLRAAVAKKLAEEELAGGEEGSSEEAKAKD